MSFKWTEKRKKRLLDLAMSGTSNKAIAEFFGVEKSAIVNAKHRFGYTDKQLKDTAERDYKKCFAAKVNSRNGIECRALIKTKCKGCNFYKTQGQHEADKYKATARIKSLNKATQAYIQGKYFAKWEKRDYKEVK